ncbi:glycosyl transferase [Paenibacillus baekrokdamisoli]|uniref:Glycosyl transferase n=1 Tax=Paenibacillus baekrokdamisoli TaxID=1712516 RepID=A0A3G9J5S0_9BACL|nr:glycosyltransferase family 2 protein [Paenibacillus baekrokdamisoli]MBB3069346.1 GT2 family glycosyltransferase [Paenibacillus baekrokdamisoli]BBH18684.1 glycosyl transferase [Paenibacillus baekrokdamisoli]
MRNQTSIILPSYNGLELLQQSIGAIRMYTNEQETPYELIVVDNGSNDGSCEWCRIEGITFISMPTNSGFPRACNKGMRLAAGDSLLLLNNDVTVTHGWLSELTETLFSQAEIGLVGPVTNHASGKQQVSYPFSSLQEFHRMAAEVRSKVELASEPVMRLIGFCLLIKREVYERIGELDERFTPGHYEDDDYCLRARMQGYSLQMCTNVFVHHEGSVSFKRSNPEEVQQLIERNRQQFITKWQIDPACFI